MSVMPRSTSQEAALGQHLVPLQGAKGWIRQSSVSIVSFYFLLLVLFYCTKHKASEKKAWGNKQRKKNPRLWKTVLLIKSLLSYWGRLGGDEWLVSLRLGERKQPGEEPVSSITALLLAVMQGEWRQQRREVTQGGDTVKKSHHSPTSFCRAELFSLQPSLGMLQESSQPEMERTVGYHRDQEVWRRSGCTWG